MTSIGVVGTERGAEADACARIPLLADKSGVVERVRKQSVEQGVERGRSIPNPRRSPRPALLPASIHFAIMKFDLTVLGATRED